MSDASITSESMIRRCKLTRSPSCFCLITSRYLLLSRRLSLCFHLSMSPSLCNCMSVCLFLPVSFSPKVFFLSRSILPYLVVFLCLPVGFLIASSLFPHVLPSAPLFVSVHLCRYICRQCLLFLFFCHQFIHPSLSVSNMYRYLYVSVSIFVSLSFCLSLYLYMYVTLSIYVSLSVSLSIYLPLSIFLFHSIYLCLFISISLSLSISLPLSVSLSVVCLSHT